MNIRDFYRKIGAPFNPGATEEEVRAAEARTNAKFPRMLRDWLLEANGFPGEAGQLLWRFPSLNRLHTIAQRFTGTETIIIKDVFAKSDRVASAGDYLIFCDSMIYLPFYATNIRLADPRFGEVISAAEEEPASAWISASSFEIFAEYLFNHESDPLPIAIEEPEAPL